MSAELQFPVPEEAQAVLQDVLAFIDTYQSQNLGSGDREKKRRHNIYSPDYERQRRERKKLERESLRMQVAQYETQLELLRLQKPSSSSPGTDSKWGWVRLATQEEDKRRQAEELNGELRAMVAQQLNTTHAIQSLLAQKTVLAEQIQSVMACYVPYAQPKSLGSFSSVDAIGAYLKGIFGQLRDSADDVFSAPLFDANSMGAFMCSTNVKPLDPVAGPCIEILSAMPLPRSSETTASMLWKMLLGKEVFGPDSGCYTMKATQSTQSSAEFGYSVNFDPNSSGALEGVTLMEKIDDDNRTVLVWTSMMTDPDGKPCFRSQGWISVMGLPCNPQTESVVRMCSRVSGKQFGVPCDSTEVDFVVARKSQFLAKSRQERVQLRIIEHAELEVSTE
ncbi:hypothetical protein KRP22_015204 [Phytophthora ramorum]|nr:hypothetical protein KRP22_15136 [Phytophthora ramorum]